MGRKCPLGTLFYLPHKEEPITAKKIIRRFPDFAKLFDGESVENTLTFYYKKDKETGAYAPIDLEAEEEVAELLGVKIKEFAIKDEDADDRDAEELRPLDEKDIQTFKNHLNDIRQGIDWLNRDSDSSSSSSSDSSDSE
jgi:hypothetical protein